jgi:hypothetical protein
MMDIATRVKFAKQPCSCKDAPLAEMLLMKVLMVTKNRCNQPVSRVQTSDGVRYVIGDFRRAALTEYLRMRNSRVHSCVENEGNPFVLSRFLDFIWADIQNNPSSVEAYTDEMSQEDDELLAGVLVD